MPDSWEVDRLGPGRPRRRRADRRFPGRFPRHAELHGHGDRRQDSRRRDRFRVPGQHIHYRDVALPAPPRSAGSATTPMVPARRKVPATTTRRLRRFELVRDLGGGAYGPGAVEQNGVAPRGPSARPRRASAPALLTIDTLRTYRSCQRGGSRAGQVGLDEARRGTQNSNSNSRPFAWENPSGNLRIFLVSRSAPGGSLSLGPNERC